MSAELIVFTEIFNTEIYNISMLLCDKRKVSHVYLMCMSQSEPQVTYEMTTIRILLEFHVATRSITIIRYEKCNSLKNNLNSLIFCLLPFCRPCYSNKVLIYLIRNKYSLASETATVHIQLGCRRISKLLP